MSKLVVGVFGVLVKHKGLPLVVEVAKRLRRRRLPIEIVAIGYVPPAEFEGTLPFRTTGPYRAAQLTELIDANRVDIAWFPVRWPETFSYTLGAALRSRARPFVPSIGALAERCADRRDALVYPWDAGPHDLVDAFEELARGRAPALAHPPPERPAPSASFYERGYLTRSSVSHRSPPRTIVTYETTHATGQYDACAYIRVRLPYRHPATQRAEAVVSLREGLLPRNAALVVVQRTAVRDERFAERLIARCRADGTPLVYETDDDLFGIPGDHPEYERYVEDTRAARLVAMEADAVTTSTESLATALRRINRAVRVLPNLLDERLWFPSAPPRATASREQRVLYMGTATHRDDLALLREAFRTLSRTFPSLTLELVGVSEGAESWFRTLDAPGNVAASYPSFVRWLRERRSRWTFAVAPLRASPFNAAKSLIKFLDYGALGLATVFSDVPPYDRLRELGAPAVLTPNDAAGWAEAIGALASDWARRRRLGHDARALVERQYTLAAQAAARRAAIDELMALRSRPLVPASIEPEAIETPS